jgi:hypothetical protein
MLAWASAEHERCWDSRRRRGLRERATVRVVDEGKDVKGFKEVVGEDEVEV